MPQKRSQYSVHTINCSPNLPLPIHFKKHYDMKHLAIEKKTLLKKTHLLGDVFITSFTDKGKCQKENIGTPVTQGPQPVIIFLPCISSEPTAQFHAKTDTIPNTPHFQI